MSRVQILKYTFYGLLGAQLAAVGVAVMEKPWWFFGILITVMVIEQLGIIHSRRF